MTHIVRTLRGGQMTIPADMRRALGIGDETMLQLRLEKGELRVRPVRVAGEQTQWFRELYEHFAPVRAEIGDHGVSEEEVERDIDAAVDAVRKHASGRP